MNYKKPYWKWIPFIVLVPLSNYSEVGVILLIA